MKDVNPMSNTKRHYVNNKDLYAILIEYKTKVIENPTLKLPDYVGICIMKICEGLGRRANFSGYSYKDEMIADAIENCITAAVTFDPEKSSNPYGYFTQVAWNAFIRRIGKEKKQSYIKHKNMQYLHLFDEDTVAAPMNNETSNQIISDFEIKLTKLKKRDIVGIEKFTDGV